MKKIISALLVLVLLSATPAAAYSKPRVALNPANHANPGVISGYNEAWGMIKLAKITKILSDKQGIKTEIFWDGYRTGGGISSLKREVARANSYNPSLFVAMHSDGVPKSRGIFVLYKDKAGKRAGKVIGKHIAKKMGLKFEGLSYRPNLYVLRQSKAPAILIEYMSHANPSDNKKLNNKNYRKKMAKATVEGVAIYSGKKIKPLIQPPKNELPPPASTTTAKTNSVSVEDPQKQKITTPQPANLISQTTQNKQTRQETPVTDTTNKSKSSPALQGDGEKKSPEEQTPTKDEGLLEILEKEIKFKPITKSSEIISDNLLKPAEAIEKAPLLLRESLKDGVDYLKAEVGLDF